MHPRAVSLSLLLLALAAMSARVRLAHAAWSVDGAPASLPTGAQTSPVVAPDGAGGLYAAWLDTRSGYDVDVFATHLDATGNLAAGWEAGGSSVTWITCLKYDPSIVADGAGGAIVAWADDRCTGLAQIYARRVAANGVSAAGWPENGVALSDVASNQRQPSIASDGAGGAFVAWHDSRDGGLDIYAQHVTGEGAVAPGWPSSGLPVCTAPGPQSAAATVPDGQGGVFVVWQDRRDATSGVYAQHLTGDGALAAGWPAGGRRISRESGNQLGPRAIADGSGGLIVAWQSLDGADWDIGATRITGSGDEAPGWPAGGVSLCAAGGDQRSPRLVADGAGGAIVAWRDRRGETWDIYGERITAAGTVAEGWEPDGTALATAPGDQDLPTLCTDGWGGALIAWQDDRAGNADLYALRVTAAGAVAPGWSADGIPFCTAAEAQKSPQIASNGAGGALAVWTDDRDAESAPDVYAHRLVGTGIVPLQCSGIATKHHDGQTFITWNTAGPGWTYRVYTSNDPIADSADLAGATLVGAVGDSSWYDWRYSILTGVPRPYAVDSLATPLTPGQGLMVVTAPAERSAFYAVTAQLCGYPENRAITEGVNATALAAKEHVNPSRPVYQGEITVDGVEADLYTLWVSAADTPLMPAMANRAGMAFDCAVVRGGVTPNNSLMLRMHPRGSNFLQQISGSSGQPGEWQLALDDPVRNQDQNTFWFGYHTDYDPCSNGATASPRGEVVDYTFRRLVYTIEWARRNFPIDLQRTYAYGYSMGGIGAVMLAYLRPDLVAGVMAFVPKFDFSFLCDPNPQCAFNPGGAVRASTDRLWGTVENDLPCSDGMPVYTRLNLDSLAARAAGNGIAPIVAFNGRNDAVVGWAEKIDYYKAVREARLGGAYFWDNRNHNGSASAAWTPVQTVTDLYRYRLDSSYPALSNASSDGDPGDGRAASGDSVGTMNGPLDWSPGIEETPAWWQVTLLTRSLRSWGTELPAPDSITVDVTPRRLQRFQPVAGATYGWSAARTQDGVAMQSGAVTADALGRVTVPQVKVYAIGTRLTIFTLGPTGVGGGAPSPGRLALAPFENPVRGTLGLALRWPRGGLARVTLLDTAGRRARVLWNGPVAAGDQRLVGSSDGLQAGVYFLAVEQGSERLIRRVVILR